MYFLLGNILMSGLYLQLKIDFRFTEPSYIFYVGSSDGIGIS